MGGEGEEVGGEGEEVGLGHGEKPWIPLLKAHRIKIERSQFRCRDETRRHSGATIEQHVWRGKRGVELTSVTVSPQLL